MVIVMYLLINKNAVSVHFLLRLCTAFQEPFLSLSQNWSICSLLDYNQYYIIYILYNIIKIKSYLVGLLCAVSIEVLVMF